MGTWTAAALSLSLFRSWSTTRNGLEPALDVSAKSDRIFDGLPIHLVDERNSGNVVSLHLSVDSDGLTLKCELYSHSAVKRSSPGHH